METGDNARISVLDLQEVCLAVTLQIKYMPDPNGR